ncbi:MAG: zf-HC2 domain-containing protein [Planctomycetales bacterium]|nr:zf-HC2 domain-containing protein [Planctomycetales bacterium]
MTPSPVHPAPERLTLLALGDLPDPEASQVRAHAGSCPECRRELAATATTLRLLRSEADAEAGTERLAEVRTAAREAVQKARVRRRILLPLSAGSVAAAGLLGWALLSGGTPPPAVSPAAPPDATPAPPAPAPVRPAPATGTGPTESVAAGRPSPGAAPAPEAGATQPTPEPGPGSGPPEPVTPPSSVEAAGAEKPAPPAPTVAPTAPATPPAPGPGGPGSTGTAPVAPAPTRPADTAAREPPRFALAASAETSRSAEVTLPGNPATKLDRSEPVPWGSAVRLAPAGDRPATLVLADGGLLSVLHAEARLTMPSGPDGAVGVTAPGPAIVYVSLPVRAEPLRIETRVENEIVSLELRPGSECLLTFNEKGKGAEGLAELSGYAPIPFMAGPSGTGSGDERRECPPGHSVGLRNGRKGKPAMAGAEKAAAELLPLAGLRRLHAKESLLLVLRSAQRARGPALEALTRQLSNLNAETVRRESAGLLDLIELCAREEIAPEDLAEIADVLRRADRAGLDVGKLLELAHHALLLGKRGEELQRTLQEILAKLRRVRGLEGGHRGGGGEKKG